MKFWTWYLRGTWAIARSGGSSALVVADLAAGVRWWRCNLAARCAGT